MVDAKKDRRVRNKLFNFVTVKFIIYFGDDFKFANKHRDVNAATDPKTSIIMALLMKKVRQ